MRLKLLAGLLGAVLAFSGGWQARGWFEDSQALAENERVLRATEEAYAGAIRMLYDELDAQAEKSIALERSNASLRQTVSALREEIANVTFPAVDCPVGSPEFVRLFDALSEAGDQPTGTDSARVSPRDD